MIPFRLSMLALICVPLTSASASTVPSLSPTAITKLHNYAACLAIKRPKVVRETLAMDFRDDDYQQAVRAVSGGKSSCIPEGRLKFAPVLVAGGMAEQAYKTDFGLQAASRIFPTDWNSRPMVSRNSSEYAALCIVQRRPVAVEALLGTKPASDAEKVALEPLMTALPGCMQPETKLALNRPFYRAILSLALYRAARQFSAPASVTN